MLGVWERRTFPIGVSGQIGKQGVVELCGVSSTGTEESPHAYFINNCSCNVIDDVNYCDVHANQFSFRNNKTENNLKDFCFVGQLDNKNCIFKIDTGSDISIVNRNLIASNKVKFKLNNCSLRYPTGEKVVVKEKVFVEVRLGKYTVKIPMLVAKINDDCILGVDFLKEIHLENNFKTIFSEQKEIQCGRLKSFLKFHQILNTFLRKVQRI